MYTEERQQDHYCGDEFDSHINHETNISQLEKYGASDVEISDSGYYVFKIQTYPNFRIDFLEVPHVFSPTTFFKALQWHPDEDDVYYVHRFDCTTFGNKITSYTCEITDGSKMIDRVTSLGLPRMFKIANKLMKSYYED